MLKSDSIYDIRLSTGRESRPYGLVLDEGSGALTVGAISQDDSVYIRNVGKRVGDFDEQRSWKGGRGNEKLSDNSEGFWDSKDAWTLTKNHVHNGPLWRFARNVDLLYYENIPDSKSWKPLYGATRGVAHLADITKFGLSLQIWLRWRGSASATNTFSVGVYLNDAGALGELQDTQTLTVAAHGGDTVSQLVTFDNMDEGTGGDVWVVFYGASHSNENEHWEIAVNASGSGDKITSDISTLTAPSPDFSVAMRFTETPSEPWSFYPFFLDGHLYFLRHFYADNENSEVWISGDRGEATGGSGTTLVDTNFGCGTSAWADNVLAGAKIRFKQNNKWYYATIASNTGGTYTFTETAHAAPAAGNPYFIYATDLFRNIATLGVVTGPPAVLNGIVYFPHGESAAIREMAVDVTQTVGHKFRTEAGANPYASFIVTGYDQLNNVKGVWRARNSEVSVSFAPSVTYGTDLTFGTAIPAGDSSFLITGLNKHGTTLYVMKENGIGAVTVFNYTSYKYEDQEGGEEDSPDTRNGSASLSVGKFFYYNWLHSVIRVFGESHDDVGQDYRGFGLPDGREGVFSAMDAYLTLPIFAVDAGEDGVSSVLAFDDIGWHELFRGYGVGKRIQMVCVQPCPGTRNRLWIECGSELIYIEMPLRRASPRLDSGMKYNHESVIESAIIDMGTASDLPKFIKHVVATVSNLNAEGMEIFVDYQTDDDCHTSTWTYAGMMTESPEARLHLGLANAKRFCYRLRINTDDATQTPDIEGIVPNGYARTPLKLVWTMRIKSGGIYQGNAKTNSSQLWAWLMENARFPFSVRMESKYLEADNYQVIVHPARLFPYKPPRPGEPMEAYFTLTLEEL